jgi:hypothetical protein
MQKMERQRDKETEIQRDKDTERGRDRETERDLPSVLVEIVNYKVVAYLATWHRASIIPGSKNEI